MVSWTFYENESDAVQKKIMIILVVLILYCSTNIFTYAFISTDSNVSKESKKKQKLQKAIVHMKGCMIIF